MLSLKRTLEKPVLIWLLLVLAYGVIFAFYRDHINLPVFFENSYQSAVLEQFSTQNFPPKLQLVREFSDLSHLGFYVFYGKIAHWLKSDPRIINEQLAAVSLLLHLAGLLVFAHLGLLFTYKNRLNPLWVSLSLALLGLNPNFIFSALSLNYFGLFFCLLSLALYFFEKDKVGWAGIFCTLATLVDFHGLVLAVAFALTRLMGVKSKILMPERILAYLLPFFFSGLLLLNWHGVVPMGDAQTWLTDFYQKYGYFRIDQFFYSLALLPIYALGFSWVWAFKSRSRAMFLGLIISALAIPLYFIFPIQSDYWQSFQQQKDQALGLVDQFFILIAHEYKNIALALPWLAGMFLFTQLLFMDILERSRVLKIFCLLFLLAQPLVLGVGDYQFLILLPFLLLLTLSEALVGSAGKIE